MFFYTSCIPKKLNFSRLKVKVLYGELFEPKILFFVRVIAIVDFSCSSGGFRRQCQGVVALLTTLIKFCSRSLHGLL